jgi:preprotein translocase subunit YajC
VIRKASHKLVALPRLVPEAESFRKNPNPEAAVWSMPPAPITSLLSLKDVDHILKSGAIRVDMVSIAHDGKLLPKGDYALNPDDRSSRVATDRIHRSLRQGDTVVLNGLEDCWPTLEELCRRLSFEVGVDVWANSYLTPPGSQGFRHHYDLHAVLIVQTSGSKTWHLYPPVMVDPIEEQGRRGWMPQTFWDQDVKEAPYLETTLNPGDVLWIPRGWVHSGYATDEHSLHVTLGFEPLTPHWLIGQILGNMADAAELRSELPWGVANSPSWLQEIAEKALADFTVGAAEIDWDSFTEEMIRRRRKRRETKKRDLPVLMSPISEETKVATNGSIIYGISTAFDGGLSIKLERSSVSISNPKLGNLLALLQREEDEPWTALDLGPDIDSAASVRIVEKLVQHGVIQVL